ncbi:MAG: hypothetical protein BMS9Abin36_0831 [Gammaproteobacteria bacterium]|nr:MAG: hypothetical protein BMS9Abin36_0831 [Gammaproteobacteria bacterium]
MAFLVWRAEYFVMVGRATITITMLGNGKYEKTWRLLAIPKHIKCYCDD